MSAPVPPCPKSSLIKEVLLSGTRHFAGEGDMWPLTWAADGNLYGGAGDNSGSPMNLWRIEKGPTDVEMEIVDNMPVEAAMYCKPYFDPSIKESGLKNMNVNKFHFAAAGRLRGLSIKPASLISIKGVLYFAVETMNYGDNPAFNRQHNLNGWIMTSTDFGKTWDKEVTPMDFLTGRLASPHFVQFGRDYEGARDEYVYALFPAAEDGGNYWENADFLLLGRVHKDKIIIRKEWEFFTGTGKSGDPVWDKDDNLAKPVFNYPRMTGENHVAYNKGIKRYIMGNFSHLTIDGEPKPFHAGNTFPSQLTLYEAPQPWGPWSLFYQDDNWGCYGDYQPNFTPKWMSEDGKTIWMVASGQINDYVFITQKIELRL